MALPQMANLVGPSCSLRIRSVSFLLYNTRIYNRKQDPTFTSATEVMFSTASVRLFVREKVSSDSPETYGLLSWEDSIKFWD